LFFTTTAKHVPVGIFNVGCSVREIVESRSIKRERELPPLFFLGGLLAIFGVGLYFFGILFSVFRLILGLTEPFRSWNMAIIWYSGVPSTLGGRSRRPGSCASTPSQAKEFAPKSSRSDCRQTSGSRADGVQ